MRTIRDRIIPQLYGFFFNAYYTHMLGTKLLSALIHFDCTSNWKKPQCFKWERVIIHNMFNMIEICPIWTGWSTLFVELLKTLLVCIVHRLQLFILILASHNLFENPVTVFWAQKNIWTFKPQNEKIIDNSVIDDQSVISQVKTSDWALAVQLWK